jgi:hypothetical protein
MDNKSTESFRSVGGLIPEDLFWEFKASRANRHESGNQAMENAIRLYLELDNTEKENPNGDGQN